jgi:spoIIIJ-associated protein
MQYKGKSVEEALANALAELNITEDKAIVTVIEQAKKGLFGRIKSEAVIEVEVKKEEKPKKQAKAEKKEAQEECALAEESSNTLKFIQGVLDIMGFSATAELKTGKDIVITIKGKDTSAIVSHHGEIIDALQTLAGAAENIGRKDYKKVVVDCENYRDKREETLAKLAHKLEAKATEMRREVILEPMSPYERRIIHTALSESETVTTKSDGKEPNRYVVIVPNDKDEFAKPYNAARNDKKGGRNNRNAGKGRGRNDRNGGNRRGGSGFIEKPKKSSSFSFGTYLGNSLKDKD